MIGYSTIGVSNMDNAKTFYSDLFAAKGGKVVMDVGRIAFIGTQRGEPMLAVCEPFDKQAPTAGNGAMIAFAADTKEEVDVLYNKALEWEQQMMARRANVFLTAFTERMFGTPTTINFAFSYLAKV